MIPGGIAVALGTAFLYGLLSEYEASFANVFCIPEELVSVDLRLFFARPRWLIFDALVLLFSLFHLSRVLKPRSLLSDTTRALPYLIILIAVFFLLSLVFNGWRLIFAIGGILLALLIISSFTSGYAAERFVIFTAVAVCFVLPHRLGDIEGRQKNRFLVIDTPEPRVVVRIYQDYMITVGLDSANKVENNFSLLRLGESPNLILRPDTLEIVFPEAW